MNILVLWLSYSATEASSLQGSKSGGDTHILEVSKYWSSIGHKVTILTSKSGKSLLGVNQSTFKVKVVKIPFERFLLKSTMGVFFAYVIRAFAALIRRDNLKNDVVVSSSHFFSDVFPAWILSKEYHSKHVALFHGWVFTREKVVSRLLASANHAFSLLFLRLSTDLVFVINQDTKKLCQKLGFNNNKIVITSNGISPVQVSCSSYGTKRFSGCFLGRLDKMKGAADLVPVWKKICEKKLDAELAVMGQGLGRENIEESIRKNNLARNITIYGAVSENAKYEVLLNSQLFIYPSYIESWCITIAEAMQSCLPVIAYDLPIYKEIFDNRVLTVPIGDHEQMAEKALWLIANQAELQRIGKENQKFISRYTWENVAKLELAAIDAIVKYKFRVSG